jgi:hypothetical protein
MSETANIQFVPSDIFLIPDESGVCAYADLPSKTLTPFPRCVKDDLIVTRCLRTLNVGQYSKTKQEARFGLYFT